jgi:GNAT superfamily N-acetyltransferase
MRSLLELLTGPRSALTPIPPKGLPPGTRIRLYQPADKDACVDIYNENEPGRFPEGFGGQFEQFLEQRDYLKLVGCIGEEPVAIGGIGKISGLFSHHVWLVFGMVKPAFHSQGIGTAMLLTRLAALTRPVKPVRVMLSSVEASTAFLARFGFTHQGQIAVRPNDPRLDVKSAVLDWGGWEACRTFIQRLGVDPDSLAPVPSADIWRVQPPRARPPARQLTRRP